MQKNNNNDIRFQQSIERVEQNNWEKARLGYLFGSTLIAAASSLIAFYNPDSIRIQDITHYIRVGGVLVNIAGTLLPLIPVFLEEMGKTYYEEALGKKVDEENKIDKGTRNTVIMNTLTFAITGCIVYVTDPLIRSFK